MLNSISGNSNKVVSKNIKLDLKFYFKSYVINTGIDYLDEK